MLRALAIVALAGLGGPVLAGNWDLNNPPQTLRGKQDRAKARVIWLRAKPVYDLAYKGKPVEQERLAAAVADIEKAVLMYEKTLRREWNDEANRELCESVEAWYSLRPQLAAPQPADEDQKRKLKQRAKREQRALRKGARKLVLEYAAAQRHGKLLRRCPSCDGLKEIRSRFGDRRACKSCAKEGVLPDRKGIVRARWSYFSPFYRRSPRKLTQVNQAMRRAVHKPESLAPFIRSITIKQVEEHDTWIRIRALVKTYTAMTSKRDKKEKRTFTAFRVGGVWWIHDPQVDPEFLEIPVEEESGGSE